MESFEIVGIIIIAALLGVFLVEIDHENTKELELIKNNKEYVIHKNCEAFDGKWYCYD